jgi:hypothetical protein
MESITWEGAERMLGTLDESQRLALFLARVRSGTVEETNIAIAAAAMGMAWVNDPPMPRREGDLVSWGSSCLSVLLTVAPWHVIVGDLFAHLDHVIGTYVVTEGEVEATAGNSEGATVAPSETG